MTTETVAIFGGTGQTGKHAVAHALKQGYKVQMMARNKSKITIQDEKLTVIEGDLSNEEAVKKTIEGATYVASFAGGKPGKDYPTDLMLNFVQLLWPLLDAEPSVKAFSYQSGGLAAAPGKPITFFVKIIRFLAGWFAGLEPLFVDSENAVAWMDENKKDSFGVIVTLPATLKEANSDINVKLSNDSGLPMLPITFKALATCTIDSLENEKFYGRYAWVVPK